MSTTSERSGLEQTRRLGVEWGPVRNGIADVAGMENPLDTGECRVHLGAHEIVRVADEADHRHGDSDPQRGASVFGTCR